LRNLTLAVLPLLILVACGGGAPATTGPAAATPTQAHATAASSTSSGPTAAATIASTPATGNVDACSLLTVAEVAAASGETLDTATPSTVETYSYCKYTGKGSEDVRTWVLTDPTAVTSVFGTMKINAGSAVAGVGDEAWWSTDSFQPGLYIMKGGRLAYISGSVFGPDDSIIQLGKLLVSRM
jgi:hypothetical protein